jgi:hypothetical protein
MNRNFLFIILLLVLLSNFVTPTFAQTTAGTPYSLEFARGVRFDINSNDFEQSVKAAQSMSLDWVNVDFDWAAASTLSGTRAFHRFKYAMTVLSDSGFSVVVSVVNPPTWAMTDAGPQPDLTAELVAHLAKEYPQILAIEIFPLANLKSAWGARPDPDKYAGMLRQVEQRMIQERIRILIIAGGLSNSVSSVEDIPADTFLQGIYRAGISPEIISLHFNGIGADLLAEPSLYNLRYYEQIRETMLENGHKSGLIWVMEVKPGSSQPASWYKNVAEQLRSQLYIGAVYLNLSQVITN